jgi:hypothetical protein
MNVHQQFNTKHYIVLSYLNVAHSELHHVVNEIHSPVIPLYYNEFEPAEQIYYADTAKMNGKFIQPCVLSKQFPPSVDLITLKAISNNSLELTIRNTALYDNIQLDLYNYFKRYLISSIVNKSVVSNIVQMR